MKTCLTMMLVVLVAVSGVSVAYAADEKKPTAQQEKMKACNAQAGEKKLEGDARKAFMSECLKGGAPAQMTQQEKMKKCNADANTKALKGDDRKKFMSECLSAEKKM